MKYLHSRIRQTRQSLGLSQSSLASAVGVSQPTVANWETGSHVPRKKALTKIGLALNVEEDWLLSGRQDTGPARAESYLSLPIRHVPIYAWPVYGQKLFTGSPEGYLPYPAERDSIFALIDYEDTSVRHRIRMFDREVEAVTPNTAYLWQDGGQSGIGPTEELPAKAEIYGRLLTEIKTY